MVILQLTPSSFPFHLLLPLLKIRLIFIVKGWLGYLIVVSLLILQNLIVRVLRLLLQWWLLLIARFILVSQEPKQAIVQLVGHLVRVHVRDPALGVLLIRRHDWRDKFLGRLQRAFSRWRIDLDTRVRLVLLYRKQ